MLTGKWFVIYKDNCLIVISSPTEKTWPGEGVDWKEFETGEEANKFANTLMP